MEICDSRFPYNKNEENLIFAKCHNKNEFWVPLIEKANAK